MYFKSYSRKSYHVCLCALLCLLTAPVFADITSVPGTSVSLDPPAGFTPSQQFPGFERDGGTSIMVNEIPIPVGKLKAGMNKQGIESQGMKLLTKKNVTVQGNEALLLSVSQAASGLDFMKWMLIMGDETRSVMVMATYPKMVAESLGDPLKKSILSTVWDPNKKVDHLAGLSFRIEESQQLKIANRISNMLMLTEEGVKEVTSVVNPLLIVGASYSKTKIVDAAEFSKKRVLQTAQVKDVSKIKGQSITVNGMNGYELTAEAKDKKDDTPLKVYQVVFPDNDQYFIVQGLVGMQKAEQFVPQFKQITQSLNKVQKQTM